MFLDEVELTVSAGRGGAGSASLHREKFAPRGGPDGGDGGRGGDVVLVADPSLTSLEGLRQPRAVRAENGGDGGPSRRHGADGADRTLLVPAGTVALDSASGELLADLDRLGTTVVLAKGGRGGRGNVHFATPTRRTPRRRELGEPGQTRSVRLELRLIADVGLVGLPNAGKSTLLARLTGAHPKVGDYPFTTLSPNLGTAEAGSGMVLTLADVPGLIEGAHQGSGLGTTFLRHLTRTRALVHLLDASLGTAACLAAYRAVAEEMRLHDQRLAALPVVIALNKLDLVSPKALASLLQQVQREFGRERPVVAISAATGEGCQGLLEVVQGLVPQGAGGRYPDPDGSAFRLYQGPRGLSREVSVSRDGDTFRVSAPALERLVAMTDLDDESSLLRLQRRLLRSGVEAALARAGAREGDEVGIGDRSFTFYPEEEAPGAPAGPPSA